MGSISARHARTVLGHVEQILAIELLCAAQALDLRLATPDYSGATPGAGVAQALARTRARVSHLDADRPPAPDLAAAADIVRTGALADLAVGPA